MKIETETRDLMRLLFGGMMLCSALATCACAGESAKVAGTNQNASAARAAASPQASATTTPAAPVAASSHGGAAAPASSLDQERALVDTAALDARIKAAVEKAKKPKAGKADKLAAAAAYLERGNVYWSAQNPSLYKFALADFRSVLHYQPDNAEAKDKMDEIVRIYNMMNRPVPQQSNEK